MKIRVGIGTPKERLQVPHRPMNCGAIILKFPQANPRLRHIVIISIAKALLIASVPTLLSVSNAAPNEEQSTGPLSAVHAFHAALAHGDAKAALALFAEDAVILEAGSARTPMNMRANISAKTSPSLKPCKPRAQTNLFITRPALRGRPQPHARKAISTDARSTAVASS
jgi:hypothetical protein